MYINFKTSIAINELNYKNIHEDYVTAKTDYDNLVPKMEPVENDSIEK